MMLSSKLRPVNTSPGVLHERSLDFTKAFDSLEWSCIQTALTEKILGGDRENGSARSSAWTKTKKTFRHLEIERINTLWKSTNNLTFGVV